MSKKLLLYMLFLCVYLFVLFFFLSFFEFFILSGVYFLIK